MATYSNQRTIVTNKETVEKGSGKIRPYTLLFADSVQIAARDLTPTALKLYLYFATQSNNYCFDFSPQRVVDLMGGTTKSYKEAFHLLEEKGYISFIEGNKYEFHTKQEKIIDLPDSLGDELVKRKFRNTKTGELVEMTFEDVLEKCKGDEERAKKIWEGATK